ncbi:MAG: PDZ domain-containing protein [Saprospiraceae bacterium]|nr:PDZ domain-containing protein [Saprospiraceae bacterium]MCF8249885.1 PDZ domain-containing protein [Saprospiraceae bacterium]MCF8279298.1 PDZ domain-containing protein [Bacteroidales bacterium]MCF8309989.1 PDZ domain-containing protein [Saprospiraceae bacterium]MCF8438889.1 PDZ domain-containing protein [Saprospiraceae bacterium]
MKRLFLSTICTLALLAFVGQSLMAQQAATTPSKQDNVIIIQKTQNDDGTWTVKKKSIQKGQAADAYFDAVDMGNSIDKVSEIIINTNGKDNAGGEGAETMMMIRKGSNRTEIKWNGSPEGLTVTSPEMSHFALINDTDNEPKAFLGIYPETDEKGGVLVTEIVEGSGAAAAGLKAGDVITVIDAATLAAQSDLSKTMATHNPGDVIQITYLRDGQTLTTTATLTGKKTPKYEYKYNYNYNYNYDYNYTNKVERDPCMVFIGMYNGSWGNGEKGVGVSGTIPGWPAEEAGIQKGDRILSLDGVPVNSHSELVIERDKHQPGERFTMGVLRDGKEIKIKARFKSCETEETAVAEEVVEQPTLPQIDNNLELEELNAYPNPTYGDLNIQFKGEAVPTTVTITDINGKQVFNESIPNFDGNYNRQLDVSSGATGTLLITVRQSGKVLTTPVVLLARA